MDYFNFSVNNTNSILKQSYKVSRKESEILDIIDSLKGFKEHYHCVHSYEWRDDITSYDGKVKFFCGIIPFDFDDQDTNQIENSHKDSKDFTDYLDSFGVDYLYCFSGNRGFHVEVSAKVFGLDGELDAQTWQKKYSNILFALKEKYKTLDTSLSSRIKKFRSLGSLHKSTKLYKIWINKNQTIEQIKEQAKKQTPEKYSKLISYLETSKEIKELSELKNIEREESEIKFDGSEKDKFPQEFNKLCITEMIKKLGNQEVVKGNRHRYFLNVVRHFYNNDRTYETTLSYITGLADACFENDKNKNERIKEQQRAVKECYEGRLSHNIGCYSGDCFQLCDYMCPVYKNLNVEKRKQFENLPRKKQNEVSKDKKEKLSFKHYKDFFKNYDITVDVVSEIPFLKIKDEQVPLFSKLGPIRATAKDTGLKKEDTGDYLEKYCDSLEKKTFSFYS